MHDLKLTFLGGLDIPGSAAARPPLTRKARGMLAYLALHPRHAQSREKLAALFWGRVPESQARTNLRQTLSALRKTLTSVSGAQVLSEGDQIALRLNGIVLDVAQFEELVAQSSTASRERALALYRGDLLDGFSLKEEAFEEWVAGERMRLRLLAIGGLEKLVADYRSEGDLSRCLQSVMRLLVLDPLREDMHRELMRTHAAQGCLGAALKQFALCRDTLRRELGVQPEPETQALFQQLSMRRKNSGEASVSANASAEGRIEETETANSAATLSMSVGAGLPLPQLPSVVVLPFDDRCGGDQAYFANGVTESIIAGLSRFHDLFVIAFTSSHVARDRFDKADDIGRELGVAYIVEGSVQKEDARIRVTAQLVDGVTGHRVWAERFDRALEDIFAVQDEITDRIVTTLAGRIEDTSRRHSARKPICEWIAYDHLLHARENMRHGTRQSELKSRWHLEQMIRLDAKSAAAHATLALSYIHEYEAPWSEDPSAAIAQAFMLAQKAVAFDEADSISHRAFAYAAHYRDEYELARKEIDRAVALNPNDYSNLCIKAWILNFSGSPEEALVCRNQSLRINPFSPDNCLLDIGIAFYTLRNYRQSAEAFAQMSSWNYLRCACQAACHAQLGQVRETALAKGKALEAMHMEFAGNAVDAGKCWIAYVRRMFRFRRPEAWDHLVEGLQMAGFPACFFIPSAGKPVSPQTTHRNVMS